MKLKKTNKVLQKFNDHLEILAKKNLIGEGKTGKLQKSIKVSNETTDTHLYVNMNMEYYGEWVNDGRKPGMGIPVDVLKRWIVSRNIVAKDKEGTVLPMTPSVLNSLSFVMNRKIKQEGIRPTYFIEESLDTLFKKFSTNITDALGDDIVDDAFKDLGD